MNKAEEEYIKNISQMLLKEKGLINLNSGTQKGGFGSVLFVEDKQTKKRYAVKAQSIINQYSGQIDEDKLLFCKQESSILESVKHKNVVGYHSDYVIGFYHFLQMNLCECSLDDWIQKRGNEKIPKSTFLHFLHQILDGIEHLHSLNYVLRDLSTKNILITTDGVIKLCDFGLAQKIDKQQLLASQIQSFNPKGVFIYFPPELIQQIDNNNEKFTQSKSGDIWAFGVCLSLLGGVSFIQASQFNQEGTVVKDSPLLDNFCNSIIKFILKANPKERPTISQIRQNIYDHLNSEKQTEQSQSFNSQKIIEPFLKNQQELELYYHKRDLSIPITSYKEIEEECLKNQDKIESLLKLSQIYLHYYSDFEKAYQYVLLSLEQDPQDPDVYLNQADIFLSKFNYEKKQCQEYIQQLIDKASKLFPNYWRIYSIKSKYYYFSQEKEKAYLYCQKGLLLNSTDPELLIRQYYLQIKKNQIESNQELLQKAESTKTKYQFYSYYYFLGYLSQSAKELKKVESYYKTQIQLANTPNAYNKLGTHYYNYFNYTKAKEHYSKALEIVPNYIDAKKNIQKCSLK